MNRDEVTEELLRIAKENPGKLILFSNKRPKRVDGWASLVRSESPPVTSWFPYLDSELRLFASNFDDSCASGDMGGACRWVKRFGMGTRPPPGRDSTAGLLSTVDGLQQLSDLP